MATIRSMRGEWQVLIRRKFHKPLNKSSYDYFRKALKHNKKNKEFQYYLKILKIDQTQF